MVQVTPLPLSDLSVSLSQIPRVFYCIDRKFTERSSLGSTMVSEHFLVLDLFGRKGKRNPVHPDFPTAPKNPNSKVTEGKRNITGWPRVTGKVRRRRAAPFLSISCASDGGMGRRTRAVGHFAFTTAEGKRSPSGAKAQSQPPLLRSPAEAPSGASASSQ
jgi:hypothetical protein